MSAQGGDGVLWIEKFNKRLFLGFLETASPRTNANLFGLLIDSCLASRGPFSLCSCGSLVSLIRTPIPSWDLPYGLI